MAISIYTSSHLYIPTKSGDVCDKEWTHLTMIGHVTKTGHQNGSMMKSRRNSVVSDKG